MATAGMIIVGTLLPVREKQELELACQRAGITISDHLRRCLKMGETVLTDDIERRQDEDEPEHFNHRRVAKIRTLDQLRPAANNARRQQAAKARRA